MTIGKGIGISFRKVLGRIIPYFFDDLGTWHKSITDNTFAEKINNLPAKILPRVANFNGTDNSISIPVITLDKDNSTIAIKLKVGTKGSVLAFGGDAFKRYLRITSASIVGETNLNGEVFVSKSHTILITEFITFIITFNNGTSKTYYNNALIDTRTITNDLTINYIGNDNTANAYDGMLSNVSFWNSRAITSQERIDYNNDIIPLNPTRCMYPTGQGSHEYDISGNGNHGTINGTGSHYDYDLEGSLYPNTQGYSLWQKAANDDIQPPFDINAAPLSLTAGVNIPAGYTKTRDIVAGGSNHNIYDSLVDMEYGSILQNDTAGVAYATQTEAYGLVFDGIINKGADATSSLIQFIGDSQSSFTSNQGYLLFVNSTEAISIQKPDGVGGVVILFQTAASYISINTDYRILVFRNETLNQFITGVIGTFVVYIQGKNKAITNKAYTIPNLTEMELIDSTGGTGTNPVIDNTFTISNYNVIDNDAGDQVSKIKVNGNYISPYDFTVSTGAYSIIDNPDNAIFNRTNATRQTATSRASLFYDVNHPFIYHIKEISDPREYSKFFNDGWRGKIFGKIKTVLNGLTYDIIRYDEQLNYATDKTGEDELKVMKYCGIDVFAVLDGDGNPIVDENGYIVIN